jgi:excisionase family DNA binding protein
MNNNSNNIDYTMFSEVPDILTVEQLQEALSISRTLAYKMVTSGEIRSIRIGRTLRIPKRYLLEFVLRQAG